MLFDRFVNHLQLFEATRGHWRGELENLACCWGIIGPLLPLPARGSRGRRGLQTFGIDDSAREYTNPTSRDDTSCMGHAMSLLGCRAVSCITVAFTPSLDSRAIYSHTHASCYIRRSNADGHVLGLKSTNMLRISCQTQRPIGLRGQQSEFSDSYAIYVGRLQQRALNRASGAPAKVYGH